MTTRKLLVALISCLALAAAPLMGCGADDPSVNQTPGDGDGDGSADGDGGNGDGQPDAGNGDEDPDSGNGDNGNGDTDTGGNGDADTGNGDGTVEIPECDANPMFYGQLGDNDFDFSGGVPTTEPFAESAGLEQIYEAIDAAEADGGLEMDGNFLADIELDEPIEIDGAIITSTYYEANINLSVLRFWLGDADRGIMFFQTAEEGGVPEQTRVGQRVKFSVNKIGFFNGNPQIRGFSDWEVIDEGNDVSFIDKEDGDFEDGDFNRIVRIGGAIGNNPTFCDRDGGSNYCYDFLYGEGNSYSITFRSPSTFIEPGDCMTFVGPLIAFPGLYSDQTPQWQIEGVNFDWHITEFDFD